MEAEAGDKVKDKDKGGEGQDNPENGQGPMSVGIVDDPELEDLLNGNDGLFSRESMLRII